MPFIEEGLVDGIRISTRPDDVRQENMELLRQYRVQTVEIGVQSLVDEVLAASDRGHSVADATTAVALLKAWGFEVSIHLMVGLPGDSPAQFAATVEAAVALGPDMVRIHPTLVFRDTVLAQMFAAGTYFPLSMAEAQDLCKYALRRFGEAGIPVIRLGLQTTPEMETPGAVVAGPFHPAFGSLVEASVFLDQASGMLAQRDVCGRWVTFHVPPRKESVFRGERNENIRILTERFHLAGIRVQRSDRFDVST